MRGLANGAGRDALRATRLAVDPSVVAWKPEAPWLPRTMTDADISYAGRTVPKRALFAPSG